VSAGIAAVAPAGAPVRRPSVTRADVAKLAGVSTAVVSYVVNDGPRPVAAATAARVREAMEMLGYLPNASARALRLGSTGTIGLVLGDSQNPHFSEYTFELGQVAAAHGKRLLIADTHQDERTEIQIVEDLVSRQVDGLLFASPLSQIDESLPLRVAGTPVVLIDCPGPIPGRRTVGADAAGGAEMLVRHLAEHGRRRIGLIVGDSGFGDPDPREQGWRRGLQASGLAEGPIVRVPFTREGGYAGAQLLLAQVPRVDAVLASNDLQGIGLVRVLQEHGISIPDDIAVAAFDGTKEAAYCWPPLTVARQPRAKLAEAAINLLLEPGSRGRHVQLSTELIRRASCGCPHADDVVEPRAHLLIRN